MVSFHVSSSTIRGAPRCWSFRRKIGRSVVSRPSLCYNTTVLCCFLRQAETLLHNVFLPPPLLPPMHNVFLPPSSPKCTMSVFTAQRGIQAEPSIFLDSESDPIYELPTFARLGKSICEPDFSFGSIYF